MIQKQLGHEAKIFTIDPFGESRNFKHLASFIPVNLEPWGEQPLPWAVVDQVVVQRFQILVHQQAVLTDVKSLQVLQLERQRRKIPSFDLKFLRNLQKVNRLNFGGQLMLFDLLVIHSFIFIICK
jgi:hypothetical protein